MDAVYNRVFCMYTGTMALLTSMLIVGGDQSPRLDDYLLAALPVELAGHCPTGSLSKGKLRRLILSGAVRVDGREPYAPSMQLRPGQRLVVRIDTGQLLHEKSPGDRACVIDGSCIVYEDAALIVVHKPAGLPVDQTMKADRPSLYSLLRRYLAERDGGGQPYLVLHHRLDKDTSGLVLFSKVQNVNKKVHELFRDHSIRKTYLALTQRPAGPVEQRFTVANQLARLSAKSRAAKWGSVAAAGQYAETDFQILGSSSQGLQLAAWPKTGRTHQIRVHLSELGMALLGDGLYGGPSRLGACTVERPMLHAQSLEFLHPVSQETVRLEAEPPEDFRLCMQALGLS